MAEAPVGWETARLVACRATPDAAAALFEAYAQDPEVARYMIWRPHRDVDETVAFLERCERAWRNGTALPWTLWLKDDGRLAGMIAARRTLLRDREVRPNAERRTLNSEPNPEHAPSTGNLEV